MDFLVEYLTVKSVAIAVALAATMIVIRGLARSNREASDRPRADVQGSGGFSAGLSDFGGAGDGGGCGGD